MLIEKIIEVAKDAGNIMVSAKRPKVMEKEGHANFCTETDEKIQAFLIERLKEVLPEAAFLGGCLFGKNEQRILFCSRSYRRNK